MDNRAGEMQIFLLVVETGSFSQAARMMRMTPSTVSKMIARIEERLGVRLIERSTRHLTITAEGRLYYERSQALLAELDDIEQELAHGAENASGTVRVNVGVAFGMHALEPLLADFWKSHPNIVVDMSLSDEIVDLYLDRTDIAFRVGPLPNSALIAQRIGVARRKIVASPAYLERLGTPKTIGDLERHNCIGFSIRLSAPVWRLKKDGRTVDAVARCSLLTNNGETIRHMALDGVGLGRLADYHVRADIAAGRLIEVLADYCEEEPIHALCLGGQRVPQRVRAFLDFTAPRLRRFMAGDPEEAPV